MKLIFLLCSIILFGFCGQNNSQNDNSLSDSSEPKTAQDSTNQSFKEILKKGENQEFEKYRLTVKKEIADKSKDSKLAPLETLKVKQNDLEARFSRDSAWWKSQLVILRRLSGVWTAEIQNQTFYDGTFKLKKISKIKLKSPKSGWENLWKRLTDEELLTLPDGLQTGGGFEPGNDTGGVTIETNIGGVYRFCLYTDPTPQSQLRETRQIAKIINVIGDEFDLKKFNTSVPVE